MQYKQEMMRDAFINGLLLNDVRRRLLEEKDLTFDRAFELAVTLTDAKMDARQFESLAQPVEPIHAIDDNVSFLRSTEQNNVLASTARIQQQGSISTACYFCGSTARHNRKKCTARRDICHNCGEKGHWAIVCKKSANSGTNSKASVNAIVCAMHNSSSNCLSHAIVNSVIDGKVLTTLIDTGSSKSYLDLSIVRALHLKIHPATLEVGFAQASVKRQVIGVCYSDIKLNDRVYKNVELYVLKDLCSQMLLGKDFQQKHKRIVFETNGPERELIITSNSPAEYCAVAKADVECPRLFGNLTKDCKPIATKSRRYNKDDLNFIDTEVSRWLQSNIVRPSSSPWRAQVVLVRDPIRGKIRLCIDYSQTINLFTELDGYPIPRMEDLVNKLAGYKLYATYDLKSAYHQIPISESDIPYTAFEAGGRLYEFNRMPFGVKNGGPVLQRVMNDILEDKLDDIYVYFDNVYWC